MRGASKAGWPGRAGLLAAGLSLPGVALAHSPIAGLNHFYNGVLHPALVPAHVLVTLALGLLCAQQAAPTARRLLAAFLSGLTLGLATLALWPAPASGSQALLAGAAVLGLLVAMGAPPAAWRVQSALAALLGWCLGLDSAPELLPFTLDWGLMLAGQAVGAGLLLSASMLLASRLQQQGWQRVARRVIGSWIAASAVMVLALGAARLPALPAGPGPAVLVNAS